MRTVELTRENILQILELYQDNFPDGWNEKMLRSAFDSNRFLCFGAVEGALIGVITVSVGIDDADIEGVVTKKAFLRRGVAKLLVKTAIERLDKQNIKKVFLEVRESNIPAKSLYESEGFKPVSVRKKYYLDGENALVMVKEL